MPLRDYRFTIKQIIEGEFVWSCVIIKATSSETALWELGKRYATTLASWDFKISNLVTARYEYGVTQ